MTSLAWRESPETQATARVARCQASWWSTSATEISNRWRSLSLRPFRTWRFPLSEPPYGRCSSPVPTATRAADPLEAPSDFLGRIRLDDVAGLHALDPLDADAALEALQHLADVVLDGLEGREGVSAGLADLRREHAAERRPHVVEDVVDHAVVPEVHAVRLGLARRLGLGLDVEAEHDGVGGRGEHDVGFVDGTDRSVDDLETHLVGRQPFQRLRQRLDRSLHVGLEHEPQFLDLARLDLLVQVLQRDARGALALEPVTVGAHGRDLPRL